MGEQNVNITTSKWTEAVISVLEGSAKEAPLTVKKLRKLVFLSLQLDGDDKAQKKTFKRAVQALEDEGQVKLDAEGNVKLKKRKRGNKDEKTKARKIKKQRGVENGDAPGDDDNDKEATGPRQQDKDSGSTQIEQTKDKNKPCKSNPQGVTRLFLGNLPFAIDEPTLETFLPGLTHIKWITDQETGKFYGSAFCEMDNSESAAAAVSKAGQQILGRPVKVNFAPSRPGDKWPPENKVVTGGGAVKAGGQAGGSGIKAMSAKPPDCKKLFVGNLSYDIDDDGITKFFASVDAEVKAVRWIHHKDTGDFKGVGFVEFWNTEACEKAATLNGKNLLGRPIRIDWTD
jgi:RNA recognition motif-containing protein